MSFKLTTEQDWCSVRILSAKSSLGGATNYDDDDDVNADDVISAVIRRCIFTLSCDQLCNFDAFCYLLGLFKAEYAALTALWSFFQVS